MLPDLVKAQQGEDLKIYRADHTSTKHVHTTLYTFGYYEWLEIRDVIVKEKSGYKKYVIEELNLFLTKMSKPLEDQLLELDLLSEMRPASSSQLKKFFMLSGRSISPY